MLTSGPGAAHFGNVIASRWQQIEERFLAAADLEPAARDAYLRDACGDDGDLRGEVDALLRAELTPDNAIPSAVSSAAQDFAEHLASSRVGERVGAYRLIDVIGHGGMGTVYLAERADDAYRARVAIKFVRGVHAAPDLARRFVAERQILADLNHPGIARLLDGGTTVDGTPYLVLEYVDGTPIDAWCDAHQLGVRERIELFLKVCDAVQYAHDVRVVHRDLKPSNILVTADGTPKLVDFGIAKLLSDGSPDDTTVAALRVLTPAYASPEQVRGEAVTFASDVYSLGVVLYQLLAGRPPCDLSHASAGEVERRICHDVPIPLSRAAVGRDGAWRDALAGELDDITATALRKRVDQRHPSVAALGAELRQYLAAPPDLPLRRAWRRVRRVRPATVVVLAGVLVVTPFAVRSLARRGDAAIAFAMLRVQVTTAPVRSPYRVVTADLNGDGRGDVVWNHVGPTINQVAVALGSPDGTIVMQPVVTDSAPFAEWSQDFHLVVGDFNGDGRDDLLWHRTGNGLRNIAWIGFSGADAALRFRGPVTLGGAGQRWANGWEVFVGDIDNDGCDDLVFNHRTQNNSTWALRSLRYGTFALIGPMAHFAKGWGGYRAFLADADGDKRADIIWNDVPVWSNRTYVARSRGDGFDLLPQQDHAVKEGWSRFHTSVADFDGDGISDLLWTATEADSVLAYIGRGQSTGVFELLPPQHLRLRNSSGTQTTLPVIGDFNGDRRSDVLWQSGSNAWIMAGSSSNRFTLRPAAVNAVAGESATDLSPLDVLPSDVNGDEREDLVWIDRANGRAYVALAMSPR
jgi:serine/threonine protein kinase